MVSEIETPALSPEKAAEHAFRGERGRVLAALRRLTQSLEEAEDMLSIAFEKALQVWPKSGVPDRPGAWLLHVARNEAKGVIRHRQMARGKHEDEGIFPRDVSFEEPELGSDYPDERLSLLFTCCHPSLSEEARVALTLSTLSALSTFEIARAFVVPEPTMAQRIVRSKKKIRAAGVPYEVPGRAELSERVQGVLQVVYLIFTEGYRATRGESRIRTDLCEDALRLAAALAQLLPEEPEAHGLQALLWFHHARRRARLAMPGSITHLEHQDRTLFDQEEIRRGEACLLSALEKKRLGSYQLQAAIAAQHCLAPSFEETPWEVVIQLYDKLYELSPSPVVALNRAAARGIGRGAQQGLLEMERAGLSRSLDLYAPYHAARAELLAREGKRAQASSAFERALSLVESVPEVAHLQRRLNELKEN